MAQHFDVSLKLLFPTFYGIVARSIFGEPKVEWINVELQEVRNPRVDMVARDRHGQLHHLELESSNDADMLALLTRIDPDACSSASSRGWPASPRAENRSRRRYCVIISGLRDLAQTVARKLQMIDLMENKVIRGFYVRGEAAILKLLLEDMFGDLPEWVLEKFEGANEDQIIAWAKRVRKADSLEAVFA